MPASSSSRRSLLVLLLAFVLLIPVNLVAGHLAEEPETPVEREGSGADHLLAPPREGDIWVLGNSIFRTGIDFDRLREELVDVRVDFEYHGGHYTSLWYLIAAHALPHLKERPATVVWGFRPEYGALPAFRQNRVNDTELFLVDGDPVYERLGSGVERSGNLLDGLAERLDERASRTGLYSLRDRAGAELGERSLQLGIELANRLGLDAGRLVEDEVVRGDATLADLLNRLVTGGEVELAEERVVDGVGDFVRGEQARFGDSFVPMTAQRLRQQGLEQLVVVWRPVHVAVGEPSSREDRYVEEALDWFETEGIPVLDFYDDSNITPGMFASGDHFNRRGRDYVTSVVLERLRSLGD